ncbi:MAG TPA: RNA polymerase sigma factor [Planctomycetota bacterium]|jgi:RNA polymerase sigma-70 factor (ECF subfamily)|nr:RNA polymerase sigma factor [Planctomycetota bacterium]
MPPSSLHHADELEILRRAISGEGEAFEEFLRRFGGTVRDWIRRWVGPAGPVDDLTHEVFMRVLRNGPRTEPTGRILVWLLRIARNLTVDWHRAQGVRKRYLEEILHKEPRSVATPLELLERRELQEVVQAALETLPGDMAATFLLRERDGLSYEEIADLLGTSSKTVSTRLHRVRQRLQGLLAPFLRDQCSSPKSVSRPGS